MLSPLLAITKKIKKNMKQSEYHNKIPKKKINSYKILLNLLTGIKVNCCQLALIGFNAIVKY